MCSFFSFRLSLFDYNSCKLKVTSCFFVISFDIFFVFIDHPSCCERSYALPLTSDCASFCGSKCQEVFTCDQLLELLLCVGMLVFFFFFSLKELGIIKHSKLLLFVENTVSYALLFWSAVKTKGR